MDNFNAISRPKWNMTATTDPGVTNDSSGTQNYAVGSAWFNTTTSRLWICLSSTVGAATWILGGVVPGVGADPANMLTLFGGLSLASVFGTFKEEGNLYRNAANPIGANLADTTDDILTGIALDASAFDISGRGIQIIANGITGATTNNKRFKVWLNPTMAAQTVTAGVISGGTVSGVGSGVLLADSGTWVNATTANSGAGWSSTINFFKFGAAASNTQYSQASNILGTLHGGIAAPLFPTQPENATMNIVVTGSSYTTGAANDVLCSFFEINAMN